MKTNKNNRRRLFLSVISLILCISMLLGTTLAWFTDSVSSTGNIIKSGRLKVAMHYAEHKDGEWKDASDATIFEQPEERKAINDGRASGRLPCGGRRPRPKVNARS